MTRMKSLASTVLSAALLLTTPLSAGVEGTVEKDRSGWSETIDQVVDTKPGDLFVLNTDRGGIEVETWDRDQVRIVIEKTAKVSGESEARRLLADYVVEISSDGDGISVSAKSQGLDRNDDEFSVSTTVTVPSRYSIDVETGGGGITIDDLEGSALARTGGGGIRVGHIRGGDVDVRTGGGGITIKSIKEGNGRAKTGGGGINVGDVTGDLEVRTGGGGIKVGDVGGDLTVGTGGGGIQIEDTVGAVTVETGGGGIRIADTGGDVDARTGGGSINISGSTGKVNAETGGGGVNIDGSGGPVIASTGGGGIAVEGARGFIEASTGGGSIEAELALADPEVDTHCDLDTGGGSITLIIPGSLQATIDAEIELDRPREEYEIFSDFDLHMAGDAKADELTAMGDINGGGDLIRLRTTNSDIRIKRR